MKGKSKVHQELRDVSEESWQRRRTAVSTLKTEKKSLSWGSWLKNIVVVIIIIGHIGMRYSSWDLERCFVVLGF